VEVPQDQKILPGIWFQDLCCFSGRPGSPGKSNSGLEFATWAVYCFAIFAATSPPDVAGSLQDRRLEETAFKCGCAADPELIPLCRDPKNILCNPLAMVHSKSSAIQRVCCKLQARIVSAQIKQPPQTTMQLLKSSSRHAAHRIT
jgi:hypothetical protein